MESNTRKKCVCVQFVILLYITRLYVLDSKKTRIEWAVALNNNNTNNKNNSRQPQRKLMRHRIPLFRSPALCLFLSASTHRSQYTH